MLPSPKYFKAKKGIIAPPIIRAKPFNVSETATAFNPPNTAYIPPMIPINHTTPHSAVLKLTPNIASTSNI